MRHLLCVPLDCCQISTFTGIIMNKAIGCVALLALTLPVSAKNIIKPTKTPKEQFSVTVVHVEANCSHLNIFSQPPGIVKITKKQAEHNRWECKLAILHKGASIKGDFIYAMTAVDSPGEEPYHIYAPKTFTIK